DVVTPCPQSFPTRRSSDLLHAHFLHLGLVLGTYVDKNVLQFWGFFLRTITGVDGWPAKDPFHHTVLGVDVHPFCWGDLVITPPRSEEHTSELQSRENLVCR